MARQCGVGIDKVGMIFLVPGMELKNQSITALQSIVHLTMGMFGKRIEAEKLSIPTTARANVADSD